MVIGVTGGIGSGKSVVLEILECDFGADVIISDEVARVMEEPGGRCYDAIVREFGEEILDGERAGSPINRKALAKIVFADKERLADLDYIVHPLVKTEIMLMIAGAYSRNSDALIAVESALMEEGNLLGLLDELWFVRADKNERISRLKRQRGMGEEEAENVIASQMSDEEYAQKADFVIDNSGSVERTRAQIKSRLDEIL